MGNTAIGIAAIVIGYGGVVAIVYGWCRAAARGDRMIEKGRSDG